MNCIVTYKGKKYSEEQFKEYFINNKQEFATSIAKNKDVIDSFKRKMEGIDYVFSQSPELASIGSKAQYLQYLSTIFKTSKVKDIVYHGADEKIEKFTLDKKKNKKEKGLFFFSKKSSAQLWRDASFEEDNTQQGDLIYALLNIKNPEIIDFENKSAWDMAKYANENIKGDGLIAINVDEMYVGRDTQYAAFEPEQIHILGSKQDKEGFKDFVSNTKSRKDVNNNREVNNLNFNTLDSEILKALKDKKWTEEMWNSVSQIEREQAIKCISF